MDSTVLTFDRVTKSYGEGRALDELSFRVGRDEIVALLGPNGAGKTTAIEIALGLRGPDAGAALLFGGSPRSLALRCRLGVTPQESGFPDMLRVEEILTFVAAHYASPAPLRETLALIRTRDSRRAPRRNALRRRVPPARARIGLCG